MLIVRFKLNNYRYSQALYITFTFNDTKPMTIRKYHLHSILNSARVYMNTSIGFRKDNFYFLAISPHHKLYQTAVFKKQSKTLKYFREVHSDSISHSFTSTQTMPALQFYVLIYSTQQTLPFRLLYMYVYSLNSFSIQLCLCTIVVLKLLCTICFVFETCLPTDQRFVLMVWQYLHSLSIFMNGTVLIFVFVSLPLDFSFTALWSMLYITL